ncbi:MAG: T9SS type A sorting domain-containing protein [Bacteroidales bacterium]|nr:T9SS type A sorting domain-containing protein [Bacteroidales bacterium]
MFWREDGAYENEVPAGYALREEGDRVYVYDYGSQKEHVLFDFSLKENDILATDWMEETDTRKNPVFRVLAVGDTTMASKRYYGGWGTRQFHYLKVYDIVHQITDMWLTGVGSVSHGISWHRDFGRSLDTLETVLCINAGRDYKNPECSTCYIPQVEPEYVYYRGKLIFVKVYYWCEPEIACYSNALAIQWRELTPILCSNIDWGFDCCGVDDGCPPFLFNGVEYHVGDSVELEGYVSPRRGIHGELYYEFEPERDVPPVFPVSIEKRQKSELKLFPNPAKETITLRATGCTLQKVEILDMYGRVLHAATLNGTETFDYNVSQMPSGIYLARVKTPCGVLTEKFSVK